MMREGSMGEANDTCNERKKFLVEKQLLELDRGNLMMMTEGNCNGPIRIGLFGLVR